MCFIDATMALHNTSGLYLWENNCPAGVMHPPSALDEKLMQMAREKGEIAGKLLMSWNDEQRIPIIIEKRGVPRLQNHCSILNSSHRASRILNFCGFPVIDIGISFTNRIC